MEGTHSPSQGILNDTLLAIEFRLGENSPSQGMLSNLSYKPLKFRPGEGGWTGQSNCRDLSQRLGPPRAKHGVVAWCIHNVKPSCWFARLMQESAWSPESAQAHTN